MSSPIREPKLIHVRNPMVRASVTFEPVVPLDGPVTEGPLIRVSNPLMRGTLTFVPVGPLSAEVTLPLPKGADGGRMFGTLNSLIDSVNEIESQLGRPGVWVDGERSGVRDGKIVLILAPNDLTDAVETCKRVADFLFAAVRTIPGATVKVISAEHPGRPLYELAA